MKVLFCTDGSETSLYAIEKALNFIRRDFEIDIVTVMETGLLTTYVTFPYEVEVGFPEYKNNAEKLLDDTENFIVSKNFQVGEKFLLTGDYTADEILNLVHKETYSAVILGSHGKRGVRKWLGSVSSKISQRSPIPVLIVKPIQNHELACRNKEILITVDGSQNSYNAVKKSYEIIDFQNSSVEILTVKAGEEDFPVEIRDDKEWLNRCLAKQDEIMREILDRTSNILEEKNIIPNKKTLLEGYPPEEILKYTEKNRKDLIIMGSHGREGLSSIILGSVSKVVLDNTSAPILIIHNKLV